MLTFYIPPHIKAIIFDLDGVIAASEDAHYTVEHAMMQKRGVNMSFDDIKEFVGTSTKEMFEKLKNKHNLQGTVQELTREKHDLYIKKIQAELNAIPAVIPLIKKLYEKKYKLAIGSSGTREIIEVTVNKLHIKKYFSTIVGADDVKKAKPAPDIFLKAAEKLKVHPKNCLVIEDAEKGVEAGKKAGMYVIGFQNPASGKQNLSKADEIIHSFQLSTVRTELSGRLRLRENIIPNLLRDL